MKCAKADEPMNIIAMTPFETDGDEDELRKGDYNG